MEASYVQYAVLKLVLIITQSPSIAMLNDFSLFSSFNAQHSSVNNLA